MPPRQARMEVILAQLNTYCDKFLINTVMKAEKGYEIPTLGDIMDWFAMCLREVDTTLDQLTESNWAKLKDGDNHGWKTTLEKSL